MVNTKPKLSIFIAGLQKAGTTSLHSALKSSKKYAMPHDKELSIFYDKLSSCPLKKFFSEGSEHAIVSPTAAISKNFLDNIKENFCIKTSIVILLRRDPVQRAISHIGMLMRRGELELSTLAVKNRLLDDMKEYKNIILKTSHDDSISLENIILNSDINFYRRYLIEEGNFIHGQIKLMDIEGAYNFFGLDQLQTIENNSSKFIKFNYLKLIDILKIIPGAKRLFYKIPYKIKMKIYWFLQTKFSVSSNGNIKNIQYKILHDEELEDLWDYISQMS